LPDELWLAGFAFHGTGVSCQSGDGRPKQLGEMGNEEDAELIYEQLRIRLDRARQILDRIKELEDAAMPSEAKATYAYEAFTPDAQQALLRAQSLAEEAHHPVIAVAH
jgi:hypothetical protein